MSSTSLVRTHGARREVLPSCQMPSIQNAAPEGSDCAAAAHADAKAPAAPDGEMLSSRPMAPFLFLTGVGLRIERFGDCSASARVATCAVAEPLRGPSALECFSQCRCLLDPLRLLPAGAPVAGRVRTRKVKTPYHGARENRSIAQVRELRGQPGRDSYFRLGVPGNSFDIVP